MHLLERRLVVRLLEKREGTNLERVRGGAGGGGMGMGRRRGSATTCRGIRSIVLKTVVCIDVGEHT